MLEQEHPSDYTVEEYVTVHYRDNKRAAVVFFNGHIDSYKLGNPMTRTQYNELHKTIITK